MRTPPLPVDSGGGRRPPTAARAIPLRARVASRPQKAYHGFDVGDFHSDGEVLGTGTYATVYAGRRRTRAERAAATNELEGLLNEGAEESQAAVRPGGVGSGNGRHVDNNDNNKIIINNSNNYYNDKNRTMNGNHPREHVHDHGNEGDCGGVDGDHDGEEELQLVAIKAIDAERFRKYRDQINLEIDIMKRLHHPNVLQMLAAESVPPFQYLVLEYCDRGDFSQFLQANAPLPEAAARAYLAQLADGIHYLHQRGVIHRDLKPSNLLLRTASQADADIPTPDGVVLVIADFGFARALTPQSVAETLCGSPLYMAPEVLQMHSYTNNADLWSIGVIFFEMLTATTPYVARNALELMHRVAHEDWSLPPSYASTLSAPCVDLLRAMLQKDPNLRIRSAELRAHPFLTGSTSTAKPRHRQMRSRTAFVPISQMPADRVATAAAAAAGAAPFMTGVGGGGGGGGGGAVALRSSAGVQPTASGDRSATGDGAKRVVRGSTSSSDLSASGGDRSLSDSFVMLGDPPELVADLARRLSAMEARLQESSAVAALAYSHRVLHRTLEAAVLYCRALEWIQELATDVDAAIATLGELATRSPELLSLVLQMQGYAHDYSNAARELLPLVRTASAPTAEQLMLDSALKYAGLAAAQEQVALGPAGSLAAPPHDDRDRLYEHARQLLEILLRSFGASADSGDAGSDDVQFVRAALRAVLRRLDSASLASASASLASSSTPGTARASLS